MNRDDIRGLLAEIVNSVVTKPIDPAIVQDDIRLQDLGVGSIEASDMIFTVEESFGILFEDQEVFQLQTVGDVLSMVEGKIGK